MTEYEAVVYDLDDTLVDLAVDWDATREAVAEVYREAGVDPGDRELWDLLDDAEDHGIGEAVEETIAANERPGARESKRLRLADEMEDGAVAVCSLNCEAACRIALEEHDLDLEVVVGRDTVDPRKPHPEPLLETIRRLGVDPDRTVFVGDGERDAETARRAGVDFVYASDWARDSRRRA